MDVVRPEIAVLFGEFAWHALLPESDFRQNMGSWLQLGKQRVIGTFHPSHLLENPKDKKATWQHIQKVMAEIK